MATNSVQVTSQESLSEERKAAVLRELARILEGGSFCGSRRCSRLLEYSVHQVLKGCSAEELKERTIGIEALQRSPDYDTGEDAIVRVTANEVRKRLAQHYQKEGAGDPVIALPAGSYGVTFQWQETPAQEPVRGKPPMRYGKWAAAAGLLLLAGWALVYGIRAARTAGLPAVVRAAVPSSPDPVWSRVFKPGQKTNIVVSDASYRELQFFLGRDVPLSEYLSPGYPGSLSAAAPPEARRAIEFLGRQQTTSIGSATLSSRLLAFGVRAGGAPAIRYPRHINVREFQTDNFILLGSRLSIPWEELFEPSLNFPLAMDPATHQFYLRNRAPQAGEQPEYRESANQEETYADIALLPNLGGTGTVLILNGIDMVAAEAAGEFAMNGGLGARLAALSAKGGTASRSSFFEILIRVRAVAGTAANMEVLALREIGSQRPRS
jgi:hypothetical protein